MSVVSLPFSVVFSQFSLSLSVPSVWGFTRGRSGVFIWGLSPHRLFVIVIGYRRRRFSIFGTLGFCLQRHLALFGGGVGALLLDSPFSLAYIVKGYQNFYKVGHLCEKQHVA